MRSRWHGVREFVSRAARYCVLAIDAERLCEQ